MATANSASASIGLLTTLITPGLRNSSVVGQPALIENLFFFGGQSLCNCSKETALEIVMNRFGSTSRFLQPNAVAMLTSLSSCYEQSFSYGSVVVLTQHVCRTRHESIT